MAAATTSSSMGDDKEKSFQAYYQEVKKIEAEDSVLTSEQQIDRLLRPGSTYFNLNPFDVLQIDPDLPAVEIKKKYRRLSILVHPDKNQADLDRAQQAFDAVNKAYKMLTDEETWKKCKAVISEAKEYVDHMLSERRRQLKKEGAASCELPEDGDPERMRRTLYTQTTKMFADIERKRRDQEVKNAEDRKKQREEELAQMEISALKKEWDKNFEESRNERVASWNTFTKQSTGKKKKKSHQGHGVSGGGVSKPHMGFKPPKIKPEKRK